MDFKALLSKLDQMETPPQTPAAPILPKAVQLNEDAELRVLAGTSSYIAEAKKKKDEEKKEEEVKEAEDRLPAKKKETTWTDKSGKKHPATQVQGSQSRKADKEAEKESKKDESVDPTQFKSKFDKMVEAKKKEKADAKMKKMEEAKKAKMKKKAEPMEEGSKPDFLDLDKDGNKKEPMKSAAKSKGGDKKEGGKKGMSTAQAKYFGGGKNESKVALKKVVAESVEQKLTFKEMVKLVQESGGQQQIDALDQELFAWAQRVAKAKFNEGMKAEIYAGLIYERMGGVFEMYDVLSEDQK